MVVVDNVHVDATPRVALCEGVAPVRELHQIGEYCCDDDGACVRDRIHGRLLDDSVVIGGDNKHSCDGRRRVRRKWHGST